MRGAQFISLFACLSILLISDLVAQEDTAGMRALLTERTTEKCDEYVFNAMLLIPDMYQRGQSDSVLQLIRFIESECDYRKFASLKELIAISQGSFDGTLCDSRTVFSLIGNGTRYGCFGIYYVPSDWYQRRYNGPPSQRYSDFEDSLAKVLLIETDSTTVAHYWLRHFTGDDSFILRHLRARDCPEACLQETYDVTVAELLTEQYNFRAHLGIIVGAWIPQDEADVLGPKAELGARAGLYSGRFGFDATLVLRFIRAREEFIIMGSDRPDSGKSFFGGYCGFDCSYELLRSGRHSLGPLLGIGYGWLGHAETGDNSSRPYADVLDLNVGWTYRFAYNRTQTKYLGLSLRFNPVNFGTAGGTDLSGDAFSITLIWGWLSHPWATGELERLAYFD